jgi:hypothetical protein
MTPLEENHFNHLAEAQPPMPRDIISVISQLNAFDVAKLVIARIHVLMNNLQSHALSVPRRGTIHGLAH